MGKTYEIFLEDKKVGTTKLEKADAPMGVVIGEIHFINVKSGYDFFSNYCKTHNIDASSDYPDDRLIDTNNIPNLKVLNSSGREIKGLGTTICGMDSDVFEIAIVGIPYPFYEEEFPHHVKTYNEMF